MQGAIAENLHRYPAQFGGVTTSIRSRLSLKAENAALLNQLSLYDLSLDLQASFSNLLSLKVPLPVTLRKMHGTRVGRKFS